MCSKLDPIKFGMFEVQFFMFGPPLSLYQIQLLFVSKMPDFCTKNLNRSSHGSSPSTSNQTIS